ncbi:unnamed protein product [Cylicocyclus nassatus]|uniref:Ubiquitin-like domain-containing protein n=1 Tax=Cylicocyclus nassatus TaxID=53992 RepID=A0AA36M811_CYLNA|nr:unnamed protein product [Cylicocyclus nassatus]
MQITAKLLGGKDDVATFELMEQVQVQHLKRKISEEFILPTGSFKVLNAGKPLHDDDLLLPAAGVRDGAKLTVVLNPIESSDLSPEEQAQLKVVLGEAATPLNMFRLSKCVQNYADYMSLDDLERLARKRRR